MKVKSLGLLLLAFFGIYVAGFFILGGNFALYKFWAPRFRDVERQVFEQTQSYVQGKNTYISRLRLQYESASEQQREALRRLILSEAETISRENLTYANQAFVSSLGR